MAPILAGGASRAPGKRKPAWLQAHVDDGRPFGRGRVHSPPVRRRTDPIDAEHALRQTSDTLLRDLDALGDLEEEKRNTPHGDPRLVELATRIEEIAGRVLEGSRRQLVLTQAASAKAVAGTADPASTISTTGRNAGEILAEWRAAERSAQAAAPGSVDEQEARVRADRLRDEYRDAFDALRRHLDR